MSYTVLIVDDEQLTLRTVSRGLRAENFTVLNALTGEDAVKVFAEEKPGLVVLDMVLPGLDGLETLRQIRNLDPSAIVIMMSAYNRVEQAVEAMKLGAFDYLVKPFSIADLLAVLQRASEILALRTQVHENLENAKGRYDFGRVVTENPAVIAMLEVARKAADADHTTILIGGESGTGKGVLARAIHYASPRAAKPLLELNCATLPDALLESELFGFEPGAFTDARRRKEGLLERAQGGTVFLDEIGNMSPSVQAKLLRVLEESSFMRLGGVQAIRVDVRLIAATNCNLRQEIADGRFREDLYYRLNVVPLLIPPLRERREDIVPLALDFVRHFNRELKRNFTAFTPAAADLLQAYRWPGNIRELKNVIERTMILAAGGEVDAADLPEEIRDQGRQEVLPEVLTHFDVSPTGEQLPSLRDLEDDYVQRVLAIVDNNKTQAARILGIHPTSLLRRLKRDHAAD